MTPDKWPECGESIPAICQDGTRVTLVCRLPLHHALDGAEWHRDGITAWINRSGRKFDSDAEARAFIDEVVHSLSGGTVSVTWRSLTPTM